MKHYIIKKAITKDENYADFLPIEPYNLVETEASLCPQCKRKSFGLSWLPPYNIKFNKKNIGDISLGTDIIVTEKFKKIYENSKLTGIKKFLLIDKAMISQNMIQEPLYLIILERTNSYINYNKSCIKGEVNDFYCSLCNPTRISRDWINGIYFNKEFVYDIFKVYDFGNIIFLSEKFVEVMLSKNITNLNNNICECENYIFPDWPKEYFEIAKKLRKK